ncbi:MULTISPECIES: SDR family oxidoreductase [unclassified Brevibacterium]|uniref:SDR family oxidoreductase n=1 Tax=unclassified Brevibacterium TaxID=2614124 RepID=UPI001E2BF314|nr:MULTISPECIES: SDR family oxidoreductase [unclassified Brevibacterium]MCD1286081.1 3-alpha-hydroxysteroid dehydrogenase [Brevibacterium sp. CCUG 69071]MDK8433433.1 SDR family oxidoreductase [Brevibacterium sp. H-BE7]
MLAATNSQQNHPTKRRDCAGTSERPGRVDDKIVFVTGGASGIGWASARALCAEGARVIIADRDEELGRSRAEELGEDTAPFVRLDVADSASWAVAVDVAVNQFGGLTGLVNNAGIAGHGGLEDMDDDTWHTVMSVNLHGVFFGMRSCLPELKKNDSASIVSISSIAGLVGFKGSPAYSASKWAVHGLTKTAAMEFGDQGMRVNSVHPGSIATPLTANLARGIGQIPAGRVGWPEEVAALVVYLISDESRFTNGASIAVDGAETAGNNIRGVV